MRISDWSSDVCSSDLEILEKETLRQRSLAEEVIAHLVLIRKQIAALEQTSKEAAAATERFESVERFVGRLEQALATLDRVGDSSGLGQETNALKEQVRALQAKVSESEIRRKVGLALARIQNRTEARRGGKECVRTCRT